VGIVGYARLNVQASNYTHALPEPFMGKGAASVEVPVFRPKRISIFHLPDASRGKSLV
jgi:hypothetical protein